MTLRLLQKVVMDYYKRHGRRTLPWRKTKNPYRILVSELMLQQTQVSRVIPKYQSFLKRFPTVHALARASLGDVLREWQGLGYNRRAKFLHECANVIVKKFRGRFPKTHSELVLLPGVGTYTAGAILAFAYDKAFPIIETNIRSVFLHFCFKERSNVTDAEILTLVRNTLSKQKSVRIWYQALMDYGSHLKVTFKNPSHQSAHHYVQKKFKGSDREIRGAILRSVLVNPVTQAQLIPLQQFDVQRTKVQVARLIQEGLLVEKRGKISLPQ